MRAEDGESAWLEPVEEVEARVEVLTRGGPSSARRSCSCRFERVFEAEVPAEDEEDEEEVDLPLYVDAEEDDGDFFFSECELDALDGKWGASRGKCICMGEPGEEGKGTEVKTSSAIRRPVKMDVT